MGVEHVFSDKNHKVLKAELPAGKVMPEHYATSDAFLITVKGKAELVFDDMKKELTSGVSFNIPGNKRHHMNVKEDFMAYIILAPDGAIEGLPKNS